MVEQLSDIRDRLKEASDQLLDERDAAANDPAKVAVAEAEFDRIAVVLSSVQTAINQQLALNLNAVAARLEDSIEAQRAIGLSTAAATLTDLVERIRSSLASPAPSGTDTGQPPVPPSQPPRGDPSQDQPAPGGQPLQGPGTSGLQAKPGKHQMVIDKLIAGAKTENLDPPTVLTIVSIESEFNPTATNPVSSAGGLFQFLDTTWVTNGGATFPGRGGPGNGQAAAAPVDNQVEIGCRFVAKTIRDLAAQLGRTPTLTAIYMAHQQGFTGALRILKSNPAASIESVVGDEAARNNRLSGLTVAQAIAKIGTLVRDHEGEALALVTTVPAIGAAIVTA
jgi:Transglycosylase SLT domain